MKKEFNPQHKEYLKEVLEKAQEAHIQTGTQEPKRGIVGRIFQAVTYCREKRKHRRQAREKLLIFQVRSDISDEFFFLEAHSVLELFRSAGYSVRKEPLTTEKYPEYPALMIIRDGKQTEYLQGLRIATTRGETKTLVREILYPSVLQQFEIAFDNTHTH
jgi:hypothetical protein